VQTFFNLYSESNEIIQSPENSNSLEFLKSDKQFSIIIGGEKSGKSTIAKIYSKINNANLITDIYIDFEKNKKTYLDLNHLPLLDEKFFHFLQYFISQKCSLTIFTSTDFLNKKNDCVYLPDILSRLRSFSIVKIEEPRDELFFKLIQKFLRNKSIAISDTLIYETMKYIDRTYLDAFKASQAINYLLYENNHNINLSIIRQYYEQI
jgi:hypothetical protein